MSKKYCLILLCLSSFIAALNSLTLTAQSEPLRVNLDGATQTSITGGPNCVADCTILGSSRSGSNLFHSFSKFSIPENVTATFIDDGAANIFTRVFGETSSINGTIAVSGEGNANFFLLNPQGVIFGPNAALLSTGSFFVSTADSISFSDGTEFTAAAVENAPPLLTFSEPVGFLFGLNAGAIVSRSQASLSGATNFLGAPAGLRVNEGRTLAFLGNRVLLEGGYLTAIGGRIQIGSVGNSSQVSLSSNFTLGYEETLAFRDIDLKQNSFVDASGGGQVAMYGRNIELTGKSIITNFTTGSSEAGTIDLIADGAVKLTDSVILFSPFDDSVGNGADLNISAQRLILQNNAVITGGTFGQGRGGNLTVNTSDSVELRGVGSVTPTLITTSTQGLGDGGDITINTQRLFITEGAQIQAVTYGPGKGGDIIVSANQIEISDVAETAFSGRSISGILASSGIEGLPFQPTGEGGSLTINTETLTLDKGAQVAVNSVGRGDSGDLEINAHSIRLDNGAQITAAAAFGNGGNLRLENLETLILRRGSTISTRAGSGDTQGNGGNIFIDADFIVTRPLEDSDIVARATQGRGGNIEINTRGLYGIEQRRAIAHNGTNDIDASSDFGISGTTAINRLGSETEIEPTALKERPLETSTTVSQRCDASGNRFVVTTRGGVPTTPARAVEAHSSLVDLGEGYTTDASAVTAADAPSAALPTESARWIEASGWSTDENGEVTLTARNQALSLPPAAHCTGQLTATYVF